MSYSTVFVHRDCRMSVCPGEFVASKTHKQDFEQDGVWQELLYQAVASRDGQHLGRLRTWIDDGFVGGRLHLLTMDSVVQSWIVAKSAKECEGLLPVHTQSTLRGMARGLAHMHSGLLAKIADFGWSKHLRTPPPGPGSANGLWPTVSLADVTCTWPYRDPEITLLLPCFPTDGWSFGVIARELVTGRSLYQLTVGTRVACSVPSPMRCGPTFRAHRSTNSRRPISNQMIGRRGVSVKWTRFLRTSCTASCKLIPQRDQPLLRWVVHAAPVSQSVSNDKHGCAILRRLVAMPIERPGAFRVVASLGEVGASHFAKTPGSENRGSAVRSGTKATDRPAPLAKDGDGGDVDTVGLCQCLGPYSCGSWQFCKGGKFGSAQCSQPTCSQCTCSWCNKIRHKSEACHRHHLKLAATEDKFIRALGSSLIHMDPLDLTAVVMHGAKKQILSCFAEAVLAAQM